MKLKITSTIFVFKSTFKQVMQEARATVDKDEPLEFLTMREERRLINPLEVLFVALKICFTKS